MAKANDQKVLTGKALAEELWGTLLDLRAGKIETHVADAVATQAREITRVVRTRSMVLGQAKEAVTGDLLEFVK